MFGILFSIGGIWNYSGSFRPAAMDSCVDIPDECNKCRSVCRGESDGSRRFYDEIAMTTLIINIRYFLMSLSVSQKVESKMSMKKRLGIAYGITDEIFAVSMQQPRKLTASYMAGLILTPVVGWTLGTFVGGAATQLMPQKLSSAMGIALYGMFIAIIIPPAREQKNVLFTVILAIAASVAFSSLPVLKHLSGGWAIILITILVSGIAAWLFPRNEEENAG